MRTSTVLLLAAVVVAGCSGSDDTAANAYPSPKKDGGADGQTGGQGGAAGSDSADASDGQACAPKSCAQLGASCGTAPDQCGGVVSCGACPSGQVCGGAGVNKCGTNACTAKSCAQLGASCGWLSDQCGSAVDCGTCPAGQTCGGSGKPNQCSGAAGTGGAAGNAGSAGQAGDAGAAGAGGAAPDCAAVCTGHCGTLQGCACNGCVAGQVCTNNLCETDCNTVCQGRCGDLQGCACGGCNGGQTCTNNYCNPDCAATCAGRCGSLQGCVCGGCGSNETCAGNYCQTDCPAVCSGHCGSYQGCACGGCGGSLVCNNGTCAECLNGDTDSQSCDPGMYCPPGTSTRTCVNGQWGSWSQCSAGSTDYRYYGDGGTRCGEVVCIQVSPSGSNTTLAVTISKVNNMAFDNDTDLTLQPSGSSPKWYYCVPTQGKTSYTFNISPADYGMVLGETLSINAWVWSPCNSSVGYQTDDAYISRCKN